ncbi:pilus assembly protein [Myxococcus stipitatus]|uniref:TadE/TadG family type IV pilus assembly protein n=1 Tax=Myxococcus stipitatus TaxID=83455 RepID=UPI001F43BDE3|nr:TadE/TadG family type IV pilus assembly protein [Myxococcus stipitatus]MCE9673057.1 pilus assembly protein [Myxococcus stipitatus]
MFSLLRKLRRDERGQAMVIGVVAMLVLAVSVMASVSIGHGVYEKIKLQDAADAQAYTLAVKEARAYNFLAYTNRAMVIHYSAMLTVMSYVSHAVYLDKTIGTIAQYAQYIPPVSAIFAAVKQAIDFWREAVEKVAQVLIPLLTVLNVALWLAQEAMMLGTVKDLVMKSGDPSVKQTDAKANPGFAMGMGSSDPEAESQIGNASVNFSNMKNFLHVIDDGPHSNDHSFSMLDPTGLTKRAKLLNANKLSDPNMAKYRLLMGNLANGVRRQWTAVGKGPILIGRRWNMNLCLGIAQLRISKTADSQIKSFDEDYEDNRKDQLYASDDIVIRIRPVCFGRWRDLFTLRFRAAADNQGGYHQEYGRRKTDDHHDWMGITPFFTADPSYFKPWQYHFSYPCNISMLSKNMMPKTAAGGAATDEPFHLKNLRHGYGDGNSGFMTQNGSGEIEDRKEGILAGFLDITWGGVGGVNNTDARYFREKTGGMMAMAVGRAIYHRPGDWREEPNFFNPLWNARIAPVKTHWEEAVMKLMIPEWNIANDAFSNALNY